MDILRRTGAALLLVFSVVGVALCLAGVVGVWVVHQPAKEFVGDTLDTLDGYLVLATQTIEQVGDRTTRLRATLDGARGELAARGEAGRGAITERLAGALQEASATLVTLRNVVQAVSANVARVNRALGQLARLPGVVPASLPDDLQTLEQSLTTIGGRVDALATTVADASLGVSTLTERIDGVAGELRSLDDRIGQWPARLAAARVTLASAKASASTAIDLASVGLTLLLVLFGAGEVSLGLQAWRWLRTPSAHAS